MIDVPVLVKDALREGTYKKNYRFVVLEEDGTESEIGTIDNDNLVSESVSIDERMCSGDTLKFGLCEGSSLEFQYFNKPNITGKRVQAFVDVQYRAGIMGRINASGSFTAPVNGSYTFEIKKGSATGLYITFAGGGDIYVDFVLGQTTDTEELEAGDVVTLNNPSSDALFEVSTDMWDTIPMGFFDVKKCSRQASTGIIKATCYNKLQSDYLDAKANEKIIEIAEIGDVGTSQEVSLYSLLQQLLEGFSIETRENITIVSAPYTSQSSYNARALTRLNNGYRSGYYLKQCHVNCYMIPADGVSYQPDEYYRLVIKAKQLADYYNDLVESHAKDSYGNNYRFATWNVAEGELVPVSYRQTLYELMESNSNMKNTFRVSVVIDNTVVYREYLFNRQEDIIISDWFTGASGNTIVGLEIPVLVKTIGTYSNNISNDEMRIMQENYYQLIDTYHPLIIEKRDLTDIEKKKYTVNDVEGWTDVTLRELQSAVFETNTQFGQLSRITDLFSGVELNHSRLYPADTLYPSDSLYPSGAAVSGFKSMYSKLWADEGNVRKWRYLIITYKGLDEEQNEKDFTLQRTVNADGTDDYNMSDNWLFRNLVWTAADVGDYADAMVAKMQDVTWFPFEMWCAGLPYIETGDEIEIPLNGESYTSYVLQRQLKGIQNLQDTYINGTLDIF